MSPEIILLLIITGALSLYAILGGADFGAGVWELNTRLTSGDDEKQLLYRAIGPVWEANHVWIIFVIVLLFGSFPSAFAAICQRTWIALLLVLAGIVFRGAAYAFRSPLGGSNRRKTWEAVFAVASTVAPFFFGVAVGQLIVGDSPPLPRLALWLVPTFFGCYAVGLCVYLAANFLTREAAVVSDMRLAKIWRKRSMTVGLIVGFLSTIGIIIVGWGAPHLSESILSRGWPFVLTSVVCGAGSIVAVARQKPNLTVALSSGAVVAVIFGWGFSQYPYLFYPEFTVESSKAPDQVIWITLVVIAVGTTLLLPSLIWLFAIFKRYEPESGGD